MRDSQGVRRNRASLAKFALPFVLSLGVASCMAASRVTRSTELAPGAKVEVRLSRAASLLSSPAAIDPSGGARRYPIAEVTRVWGTVRETRADTIILREVSVLRPGRRDIERFPGRQEVALRWPREPGADISETHLAGGRTIALGLAIVLVILAAIGASDSPAD